MVAATTDSAGPGAPSARLFGRRVAAAVALTIVAIALATVTAVERERRTEVAAALERAETLAVTLASDLGARFAAVELVLMDAAGHFGTVPPGHADSALERQRLALPHVRELIVLDTAGRRVAGAADPAGEAAARAALERLRRGGAPGLASVEPDAGGRLWTVARPISGAAGGLKGVAVATLEPARLGAHLDALALGPGVAVVVAGPDGTVLTRWTPGAASGGDVRAGIGRVADAPAARRGAFLDRAGEAGRARPTGYARVAGQPLVIAVSLDGDAAFAHYREAAAIMAGLGLLLATAAGLVGLLLHRGYGRVAGAAGAARAAERSARSTAIRQQSISVLSQYINERPEPADLLRVVAGTLRETLRADAAAIFRPVDGGPDMGLVEGAGLSPDAIGRHREAGDAESCLGRVIAGAEAVIRPTGAGDAAALALAAREGLSEAVLAPADTRSERGATLLGVFLRRARRFSEADRYFVEAVARLVTVYFERRREEHTREAVFDSVGGSMAVLDSAGRVVMVNRSWRRFAPSSEGAAGPVGLGASYLEVCETAQGEDAAVARRIGAGIARVLAGEADIFQDDYPMLVGSSQRWLRAIVSPAALDDGRGAVVLHIDITEQRQMEEQLREAQRVEALGQLTGGIAHDFNNLLTVIIGNADVLAERHPPDSDAHKLALRIEDAATRGADLTSKLLSFARRQKLAPALVDPAACLQGVHDLLSRTLRADIRLVVRADPDCPPVRADASQLTTALVNLVLNARDALPEGGEIVLRARAHPRGPTAPGAAGPAPNGWVCLSVADTGAGVPEELRSRVFEPFFTTKSPGAGTGLGLSMVHGFARQSGGTAELSSDPGAGTEVRILLPAAEAGEAAAQEASRSDRTGRLGAGRSVLLVEDEEEVRALLVAVLDDLGFVVHEAGDGPEALACLDLHGAFDLMISDVILPGDLTGYGIAAELRRRQPGAAILLISGYSELGSAKDVPSIDRDLPLLAKPFRRHDLVAAIEGVLAASEPRPG